MLVDIKKSVFNEKWSLNLTFIKLTPIYTETSDANATYGLYMEMARSGVMKKSAMDVNIINKDAVQKLLSVSRDSLVVWNYHTLIPQVWFWYSFTVFLFYFIHSWSTLNYPSIVNIWKNSNQHLETVSEKKHITHCLQGNMLVLVGFR